MNLLAVLLRSKKWLSVVVVVVSLLGVGTVGAATGSGGAILSAVTGSSSTPAAASATTPEAPTATFAPAPTSDTPTPGSDTPVAATPMATAAMSVSSTPIDTPAASADTASASTSSNSLNTNGGAGANNSVHVVNHTDGRLKVRGSVQVNQIQATNVGPENLAYAYGSCTNCQTFAVALQVNLYNKNATRIVPKNAAIAVNYQCTGCTTVALAYQYAYGVDDPSQVPQDVNELIHDMNQELTAIQTDHGISLSEAESRIQAVVDQFQELAPSLDTKRQEATDATSPVATPVPADTGTPEVTATSDATSTAAATASPVDMAGTMTPTPVSPEAIDTATPLPTATATPREQPDRSARVTRSQAKRLGFKSPCPVLSVPQQTN